MADAERKLMSGKSRIDFQTDPSKYRHWKLRVDGDVATLTMDVDEKGALFEGYELKLNSYDLGVDIELADAIERLRFEHPQVSVILLRSGKPRVFCAGAEHARLAGAQQDHPHLRMLEAQPLDSVGELDVDAEVVGIELELVAFKQRALLVDVHRERGDVAVDLELPMAV